MFRFHTYTWFTISLAIVICGMRKEEKKNKKNNNNNNIPKENVKYIYKEKTTAPFSFLSLFFVVDVTQVWSLDENQSDDIDVENLFLFFF